VHRGPPVMGTLLVASLVASLVATPLRLPMALVAPAVLKGLLVPFRNRFILRQPTMKAWWEWASRPFMIWHRLFLLKPRGVVWPKACSGKGLEGGYQ
jgi:hypothetical protein